MSNTQNDDPCPLERRVGRADGETTPGTEGIGSLDSNIRRNTRSTAIAPYGPMDLNKMQNIDINNNAAITMFTFQGHSEALLQYQSLSQLDQAEHLKLCCNKGINKKLLTKLVESFDLLVSLLYLRLKLICHTLGIFQNSQIYSPVNINKEQPNFKFDTQNAADNAPNDQAKRHGQEELE